MTYFCFYAALSAEALARLAHPLALNRIESLELAQQYYVAAKNALPSPAVPDELDGIDYGLQDAAGLEFQAARSDTASVADREHSVARTRYSVSSIQSDSYIADTLFPKPPSVRSSSPAPSRDDQAATQQNHDGDLPPHAPATTLAETSSSPEFKTYQARQQSLEYTTIWLRNKSIDSFNAHLIEFQGLLTKHLVTVELLIDSTKEGHSLRHTTKRPAGFGDDQAAKAADRKDRLQRLKANGWARERFQPEYYEQLRERALDDLVC